MLEIKEADCTNYFSGGRGSGRGGRGGRGGNAGNSSRGGGIIGGGGRDMNDLIRGTTGESSSDTTGNILG